MDKEKSIDVSASIGRYINENAPVIKYTKKDVDELIASIGSDGLSVMKDAGMYDGDPETLYVASTFCGGTGLNEKVDDDFLVDFYSNVKKLDAADFLSNPYVSAVRYKEVRCGKLFLAYSKYVPGELFQYDMPDFDKRLVVPKIGFFTEEVRFPTIYEGNMPWMSVCPSETSTIDPYIEKASGNVLVLGLGLGYYPFRIAELEKVNKIVIVEINYGIIDLFKKNVFPFFPHKEKYEFVCADAVAFLKELPNDGRYDYCFADIWEGVLDGLKFYDAIKEQEERLTATKFGYWIEPQLKAFKKYRGKTENE